MAENHEIAVDQQQARIRLLETAERLFSEYGFAGASVRDITGTANCNTAAVNYHFGNKENLYVEVYRRRIGWLRDLRVSAMKNVIAQENITLEQILQAFAQVYLEPLVDEVEGRRVIQLIMREMLNPHLPEGMLIRELFDPVDEVMRQALRKIYPEINEVQAELCIFSVVGQLIQIVQMRKILSTDTKPRLELPDIPGLIEHVVNLSAAGIRFLVLEGKKACTPDGQR